MKLEEGDVVYGDETDPCTVYVSLEHESGCAVLDLVPFLRVLGAIMIFFGCVIQYFGLGAQKKFMQILVGICTFSLGLVVFYKLDWLAMLDPTDSPMNHNVALTIAAIAICILATYLVTWTFKKFIRIAPTVIGFCAGYWFAIYVILIVNYVGSFFVPAGTKAVGTLGGALIELTLVFMGAMVGYTFSFIFILTIQTFISAYLIVRGSTLWVNLGFPNEVVLLQSVTSETNGLVKLPAMFFVYILLIMAIWLTSLYHQFNKTYESGEYKYYDEDSD